MTQPQRAATAPVFARRRRNINLTANYTASAADNDCTFTNNGAAANIEVTIPSGLPLSTRFRLAQNSSTFSIAFRLSGTERIRDVGSTTSAAGAATYPSTATGAMMEIERVNGVNGDYGVCFKNGATPTYT